VLGPPMIRHCPRRGSPHPGVLVLGVVHEQLHVQLFPCKRPRREQQRPAIPLVRVVLVPSPFRPIRSSKAPPTGQARCRSRASCPSCRTPPATAPPPPSAPSQAPARQRPDPCIHRSFAPSRAPCVSPCVSLVLFNMRPEYTTLSPSTTPRPTHLPRETPSYPHQLNHHLA
jgi:hypothetical protein